MGFLRANGAADDGDSDDFDQAHMDVDLSPEPPSSAVEAEKTALEESELSKAVGLEPPVDAGMGTVNPEPNKSRFKALRSLTPAAAVEGAQSDLPHDELHLKSPFLSSLDNLLKTHDWSNENGNREIESLLIQQHMQAACSAGYGNEVDVLWNRHAPQDHPGYQNLDGSPLMVQPRGVGLPPQDESQGFVAPSGKPMSVKPVPPSQQELEAKKALEQKQAEQQAPSAAQVAGGASFLSAALSAPFALAAAGGSLALQSLKSAGKSAKSFYTQHRIKGHDVLADQLDHATEGIQHLTDKLRMQGMGDLIDRMKSTGLSQKAFFDGMAKGHHPEISQQFDALMQKPDFAKDYSDLMGRLDDFSVSATRFAETGVELDQDPGEVLDRNLNKISDATDWFIDKKDGVIKQLRELVQSLAERIGNLINKMMGRMKPA